jgi:hypothetical protein
MRPIFVRVAARRLELSGSANVRLNRNHNLNHNHNLSLSPGIKSRIKIRGACALSL